MATQIQLRRGTAAAWTTANTILAAGEEGYETDTGKRKVGDGTTAWASLAYVTSGHVIEDEGTPLTSRSKLNFIGAGVAATDNAGADSTDITINTGSAPDADATTKGLVQLAGDLTGTAASPQIAAGSIVNADINAAAAIAESKLSLASDAAAGTASRRTLGTGATQAAAGNDSRLSGAALNTQTTDYTLALTDAGKVVEINSASAQVATVPPNSSVAFPVGTIIEVRRYGAGTVTLAAGAGVTINSPGGLLAVGTRYASASLQKRATDEWIAVGDLA